MIHYLAAWFRPGYWRETAACFALAGWYLVLVYGTPLWLPWLNSEWRHFDYIFIG